VTDDARSTWLSKGNPFPVDQTFAMDIGTFCETVIKNREPLLVANAIEDDQWKSAPETGVGMVSYLGFPVLWPDGRMFGTICVLDHKANRYSDVYQEVRQSRRRRLLLFHGFVDVHSALAARTVRHEIEARTVRCR
jgi:hypothetical protein